MQNLARQPSGSDFPLKAFSAKPEFIKAARAIQLGFLSSIQEWAALQKAFQRWPGPDNFDERGIQRISLSSLTAPHLKKVAATSV